MSLADSLVSGGLAGTCVDLFFFPIDTLKTRLQAKNGFRANGGWSGIYSGVGSTIVASAPGAALFFVVYDQFKLKLRDATAWSDPVVHMAAANCGEIAACSVRVPSEVIKQRVQTGQHARSMHALRAILANQTGEGVLRGLYRGYGTTLMREIPFTAIQFPLYERLKVLTGAADQPLWGALCGSIAGAVAAASTTPLDVCKTRIMLQSRSAHGPKVSAFGVLREIYREGPTAFFRGIVPRTLWISAGGAVFLGVYEVVKDGIQKTERALL